MEFIDLKAQYQALRSDINARIQTVLDHGQYIMGPEVGELEGKLAAYTGARHCITVSSGTEALLISLMALGIERGDEIVTTPFSFIATAEAIVLLGAVPPLMLRTEANPQGTPKDAFDGIRAGVAADRSQFYWELSEAFYGFNRPGATVSEGVRRAFWMWSMQAGLKGAYDCVAQFSETDFTEDLRRIDVPTLVAHGDDDQIVPIAASAHRTSQLVKDATLKVYPGAPHGLVGDYERAFNDDLLNFLRG